MTDASASRGLVRLDESHYARHASSLNDYGLFMRAVPLTVVLTTIGFNHHFRFEDYH